jgi:hypothetical protein
MIDTFRFNSVINNAVTYGFSLEAIRDLTIPERHMLVSIIPTPKEFVEQKQGIDYVKANYMREIAQIWYNGFSFNLSNEQIVTDPDGNYWASAKGTLNWGESGEYFSIDVWDAHRIQFSKGTKTFVDLSNDTKSVGTDALKKAMNIGLNISDDVYRWQGCYLPLFELNRLVEVAKGTIKKHPDKADLIEKYLSMANRANYTNTYENIKGLE